MRYLMFLLGLMFANVASAMDCEKVPDCVELGYSTEDDPDCEDNGYMYCPFDHKYKKCVNMDCAKMGFSESDKSSWCAEVVNCKGNPKYTACNCLKPRCNIGDVFYSDGSCGDVKDYTSDKISVGVVYYTNCAGGGKVINLHDLSRASSTVPFDPAKPYEGGHKYFLWGDPTIDTPGLENWKCDYVTVAKTGDHSHAFWSKGKAYTETLAKAQGNNSQYPAAAALAFYPIGVSANDSIVGAGHWYLPTLGEWMDVYGYDYSNVSDCGGKTGAHGNTIKIINETLTTLKSKSVAAEALTPKGFYWSSLEASHDATWRLYLGTDLDFLHSRAKTEPTRVRVSLEF